MPYRLMLIIRECISYTCSHYHTGPITSKLYPISMPLLITDLTHTWILYSYA